MARTKMKKEGMNARIFARGLDEEVVKGLREYVIEKYGSLHGHFGKELELAVRKHLEEVGYYDAHAHKPKAHKPKGSKKAGPQNEVDKRSLMYASYGDPGDNDGRSDVRKLPNPNEPGIPPSERTKRRIIWHLKSKGMLDVERINENAIKRVIGMEAGYDSRTINRYFDILETEYLLLNIEYTCKRRSRSL